MIATRAKTKFDKQKVLVKAKQANDDRLFAEHVNRGVATVAVKTGTDGGMHPVFLAKLQGKSPFELAGLILLVALIGAIVLTHRRRGDPRGQNIARQVDRDPAKAIKNLQPKVGEGVKL